MYVAYYHVVAIKLSYATACEPSPIYPPRSAGDNVSVKRAVASSCGIRDIANRSAIVVPRALNTLFVSLVLALNQAPVTSVISSRRRIIFQQPCGRTRLETARKTPDESESSRITIVLRAKIWHVVARGILGDRNTRENKVPFYLESPSHRKWSGDGDGPSRVARGRPA